MCIPFTYPLDGVSPIHSNTHDLEAMQFQRATTYTRISSQPIRYLHTPF